MSSDGLVLEADTYVPADPVTGDRARLVATLPGSLLASNRAVRGRATRQKRGRSKQDFGTSRTVIAAVEARFGRIGFDLAADTSNAVVRGPDGEKLHFDKSDNTLIQDWARALPASCRVAWLNPEFGNLGRYAEKCAGVRYLPRWTLMLCPASMGSKWWAQHVLGKCMAFGIPRIKFVGADMLYPKDLALLAYGYGVHGSGYWDWRQEPL